MLFGLACLALLLTVTPGCRSGHDRPAAKFVLVFVDVSRSTLRHREVLRKAWQRIVALATPGDRIVLARISDATLTTFDPVCDSQIEKTEWYQEATLKRRQRLTAWRQEKLEPAFESALCVESSRRTEIINALLVAEKVFGRDPRRRVLVLLSDMIEDSREMDFKAGGLGRTAVARIVAQRKAQARVPTLRGVRVYVAGATAPTAAETLAIQGFWIAYFKATGADLDPRNYGYALVDFEGGECDHPGTAAGSNAAE